MKKNTYLNLGIKLVSSVLLLLTAVVTHAQTQSVPYPERFVQCDDIGYTINDKEGSRFVFVTFAPEYIFDNSIVNPLEKINKFSVARATEESSSEFTGLLASDTEIFPMKVRNYTVLAVTLSDDESQTYPLEYLVELVVSNKSISSSRILYTKCHIGSIGKVE